jgi:hypothetical protein
MKRVLPGDRGRVAGECLCGGVRIEIDYPAFWAWHDHSHASRLAHGAAYATYVGSWRKRFWIVRGSKRIVRYEDRDAGSTRAFCRRCGTPIFYERKRSPHMVNIPRALFQSRTGRHPLYHAAISELQDWNVYGRTSGSAQGVSRNRLGASQALGASWQGLAATQSYQENFLHAALGRLPSNATCGLYVL